MSEGSPDHPRERNARYLLKRCRPAAEGPSQFFSTRSLFERRGAGARARFPYFQMAFQPIVDVATGETLAQEALAREEGSGGPAAGAAALFRQIAPEDLFAFEALCRERAIQDAIALDAWTPVSLNMSPAAVLGSQHGLMQTLDYADRIGMPYERLIFELTETSVIADVAAVEAMLQPARDRGVRIALDDFGAGYNGLQTLISLKPDMIKVDISLIRDVCFCEARRIVIESLAEACSRLDILVVAEGVETVEQVEVLQGLGVGFMQGYLFARPQIEQFPVFKLSGSALSPRKSGRRTGG